MYVVGKGKEEHMRHDETGKKYGGKLGKKCRSERGKNNKKMGRIL